MNIHYLIFDIYGIRGRREYKEKAKGTIASPRKKYSNWKCFENCEAVGKSYSLEQGSKSLEVSENFQQVWTNLEALTSLRQF